MRKTDRLIAGMDLGAHYNSTELSAMADDLLREDARTELCRKCGCRGDETGKVAHTVQEVCDGGGNQLPLDFPEYLCANGHHWYAGEGSVRSISGKDPILFEEHFQSRRRREIYNSLGSPDPSIVSGLYNRCVDAETEALTPAGWRRYDALARGTLVWTYEIESDRCQWSPVNEMYVAEYNGIMMPLESRQISALVTPGHRWAVVHERNKTARYEVVTPTHWHTAPITHDPATGRILRSTRDSLMARHYIPLARKAKMTPVARNADAYELLGWIIADGSYKTHHDGMTMYQAMHNPKLGALRRCLEANGENPEPHYVDENNVGQWYITVGTGRRLRAIAPQKRIAAVTLIEHETGDLDALLTGLIYGDGSLRSSPHETNHVARTLFTTKQEEARAAQALATVVGVTTSAKERYDERAFCPEEHFVYLKEARRASFAYVRTAMQEPITYDGVVWCPTVDSGFWVARRNGTVYVTGNSHPQGRKINSPEARAKHGASYYRG